MVYSTWSTVTHIFGWFSFFTAIWATITLFVLIEKKSRKEFGGYKNFLRVYCFYAFIFSTIDWVVQPYAVMDINGLGYVFYSENRLFDLGYSLSHLLQILYCGCFIASSSFLSLNFIYRYVSSCHSHYLHYIQDFGLILIIAYCILPFVIWSICVYYIFSPTSEKTEYINMSTMQIENFNISGNPYVGVICYYILTTPLHNYGDVDWWTMGALLGLIIFQIDNRGDSSNIRPGTAKISDILTRRLNYQQPAIPTLTI
ncbi:Seven TM Receptor [Caenorhabditis elegans]|uniref:Seven TM Receptor n=1 Tax=Caenorhabditis elegans TaxID=6239 RepID=E3W736_CAEEL|nr:Seven TM Receptor [Caenorhabditis elegans]CBX53328.1 Seven TM Receptor [Caenorhabditis elegans]|eukprot:NP_001256178.1 Seven TM Receptor [Caenorhabditis elegans]